MIPLIKIPTSGRTVLTRDNLTRVATQTGQSIFDLEMTLNNAYGRNTEVAFLWYGDLLIYPQETVPVS